MFDADGVLLSSSRFESELRAIGLLHEDPTVSSIFNVDIRNPGGDLSTGHIPEAARRFYERMGGKFGGERGSRIGAVELRLICYEWPSLAALEACASGLDEMVIPSRFRALA